MEKVYDNFATEPDPAGDDYVLFEYLVAFWSDIKL
jgi:hypothetical protein